MKKEDKKRSLFGKDYLMLSAMTIGLLAGAGKAQTVKADTVDKAATEVKATNTTTTTAATTTGSATTAATETTTDTAVATNDTTSEAQTGTDTETNTATATDSVANTNATSSDTTSNVDNATVAKGTATATTTSNNSQTATDTTTTVKSDVKDTTSANNNNTQSGSNTGTIIGDSTSTDNTSNNQTSGLGKQNVSEDVSNENIGEGSIINSYLTSQAAKDNYTKLNDTAKKIVTAALREGSTVDLAKLTETEINALNRVVLTTTDDNQYTLKDYDSIAKKIVNRDSSSQIPLFKGEKIVNMPGLEKVKDAETGEEATMDIWDSWPVQDPETGYVENWNGYQLVVAMIGIPHKGDNHLYLLYS